MIRFSLLFCLAIISSLSWGMHVPNAEVCKAEKINNSTQKYTYDDTLNLRCSAEQISKSQKWHIQNGAFLAFVSDFLATKSAGNTVVRTTRAGDKAIRTTRPDGSVVDISPKRVKEFVPNTHPKAPPGALNRVKFDNAIPGSKGFKRPPTQQELDILKKAK